VYARRAPADDNQPDTENGILEELETACEREIGAGRRDSGRLLARCCRVRSDGSVRPLHAAKDRELIESNGRQLAVFTPQDDQVAEDFVVAIAAKVQAVAAALGADDRPGGGG
jgi:hypothetical protein